MNLLDRRVLFFGGKGGVGKTTVAAAFALRAARQAKRTLLVSTDPAHSTSDILEVQLGSEPTLVEENLWAMEIDPETETQAYIDDVKERISESIAPRLVKEVERQIDVARMSPGAEESAVFERFAKILCDEDYQFDRYVFDTAPTGHTIRLLSLPELMTVWISGLISQRRKVNVLGKMWRNVAGGGSAAAQSDHDDPVLEALEARKSRFERAREIITNKEESAFVFVLTPERLPILETERAVKTLQRYDVPIGAIVVNQVLPAEVQGEFLARRKEREQKYLDQIKESFRELTTFEIRQYGDDVVGRDALLELANETFDRPA